jgi:hypothetical protein
VLGNLPRSRPGHRSDKRGGGRPAAAEGHSSTGATGSSPTRAKATRAATKPAANKRTATAKPARARPTAEREPATAEVRPPCESVPLGPTDPLTGAVRLAGKVAEAGLKTAGSLLRRLPGR